MMDDIIIDKEFQDLLPELDTETFGLLEENIIENGCRDALVIWNNILVDGYNRFSICKKHGIPFITIEKSFESRENAIIWIISNQVSRRNLSPIQLSHYRGLHYRADKRIIKNKTGKNQHSEVFLHNEEIPHAQSISTVARLSKHYKVSKSTIERDAKVAAAIDAIGETSPDAKKKILSGEATVDKKELGELSAKSKEEIKEFAEAIETGAYEKQKNASHTPAGQEKTVDSIRAGMRYLNTGINKISNGVSAELPGIIKKSDRSELKTTLRSYIDKLEYFYDKI